LFYRLNVFPIEVPPLRQRREDIPMLVEYFVGRYAEKAGKDIRKIDGNSLKLCQSYSWPGNIRELQNIIERSVILCNGDTLRVDEAWLSSQQAERPGESTAGTDTKRDSLESPRRVLHDVLQHAERQQIVEALEQCNWVVGGPKGTAARLGMKRSTLQQRIRK